MTATPDILCIGSILWDIIGRSSSAMRLGSDVPGRITRLPGGVAMNIAMTLARFGMRPAILTAIGRDAEGDELVAACQRLGLVTDHAYRSDDLPTDRYMAIEGAKFRNPVEPGCLLQLDVEFVQKRATVCKFAGRASVDGKLAAEANFTAMIADPPA